MLRRTRRRTATAWQMSTIAASGWMFSTTPCRMPTKGSLRPKSVVKVIRRGMVHTFRKLDAERWRLSNLGTGDVSSSRRTEAGRSPKLATDSYQVPMRSTRPPLNLHASLVVEAIEVVGPGVRVFQVNQSQRQSVIELVIHAGAGRDAQIRRCPSRCRSRRAWRQSAPRR